MFDAYNSAATDKACSVMQFKVIQFCVCVYEKKYSNTKNHVDITISFLNTDGSSEDKREENLNIFGLKV